MPKFYYTQIPHGEKFIRLNADGAPSAYLICPRCGYDRIAMPTKPELLKQYESEGLLDVHAEVVEVQQVIGLAERDVFMPVAIYLPACVISGTLAMARVMPWQLFEVVLIGGAIGILMFAVRYRTRVVEPEPEEEAPEIPDRTEIVDTRKSTQTLFSFSKDGAKYQSGEPVPDYYLWRIADAYAHGVPFSKQMYTGSKKAVSRPAFESVRDAFVRAGIAYLDGQDVALNRRGMNILGQWAALDCPPIPN